MSKQTRLQRQRSLDWKLQWFGQCSSPPPLKVESVHTSTVKYSLGRQII